MEKNYYSISKMGKIGGFSERTFARALSFFDKSPSFIKRHAGRISAFYSEEDYKEILDFLKKTTEAERKKIYGEKNPRNKKRKNEKKNFWNIKNISEYIGCSKHGLTPLLNYFSFSLSEIIKEKEIEKIKKLKEFYISLGKTNQERGRKMCEITEKINPYRKNVGKKAKETKRKKSEEIKKQLKEKNKENYYSTQDITEWISLSTLNTLKHHIDIHPLKIGAMSYYSESDVIKLKKRKELWEKLTRSEYNKILREEQFEKGKEEAERISGKKVISLKEIQKLAGCPKSTLADLLKKGSFDKVNLRKNTLVFYFLEDLEKIKELIDLSKEKEFFSLGEKICGDFLKENNILYETQKTFEGCFLQKNLFFDFYLPKENICIEIDGAQHQNLTYFSSEKNLEVIKKRDYIKNNFCKKIGVKLIRIPWGCKGIYTKKQLIKRLKEDLIITKRSLI